MTVRRADHQTTRCDARPNKMTRAAQVTTVDNANGWGTTNLQSRLTFHAVNIARTLELLV